MTAGRRIESVDLARGIASLIMIQGHAYQGWVAPEHFESNGYLATRLLGTLPLPSFLVLSGAAIGLRLRAARERGEPVAEVRRSLVARGLSVVLWGYLLSLACALIDGGMTANIVLRADVLHAIGLSIAVAALWCLAPTGSGLLSSIRRAAGSLPVIPRRQGVAQPPTGSPLTSRNLVQRALLLAVAAAVMCPVITGLTQNVRGPSAYWIALWSHVDGITRMPVIPLVAWTAVGIMGVHFAIPTRGRDAQSWRLFVLGLMGLAAATMGSFGTGTMLAALGGELSRAHMAVIPNVLDGAGRGLFVLGMGAWQAMKLPHGVRLHLSRIGQASLVTYIFHIPFCYGALAGPLANRLDMPTATFFVALLMLASYGAVIALGAKRRLLYDLVSPKLLDGPAMLAAVKTLYAGVGSRARGRMP